MDKIFIGIPTTRDFKPFWKSVDTLIVNAREFYEIKAEIVSNLSLGDAQNKLVDWFLETDNDYLLFLDDDQWGHTIQMLHCLVNAMTDVATIKTYGRNYPYTSMLLKYSKDRSLSCPIEYAEGYSEVDICGFPMTLIKRRVFDLLDKPYFREVEFGGRTWNTDVDFCERLEKVGIKPVGCFQHCLNHDIVTSENVYRLRREHCTDEYKKAQLQALNIQQEILREGV